MDIQPGPAWDTEKQLDCTVLSLDGHRAYVRYPPHAPGHRGNTCWRPVDALSSGASTSTGAS